MEAKSVSIRCGFFSVLIMSLFLFTSYRCIIIAFLSVKSFSLPINSFNDVLDSDMDVIVYTNDATADMYKLAPNGSVLHQIYQEKIHNKPTFIVTQMTTCHNYWN